MTIQIFTVIIERNAKVTQYAAIIFHAGKYYSGQSLHILSGLVRCAQNILPPNIENV